VPARIGETQASAQRDVVCLANSTGTGSNTSAKGKVELRLRTIELGPEQAETARSLDSEQVKIAILPEHLVSNRLTVAGQNAPGLSPETRG
jgi:hypothetical protein